MPTYSVSGRHRPECQLPVLAILLLTLLNPALVIAQNATVAFVAQDTSTQGNWKGVYGADGWNVIGDTSGSNPNYPGYATVTPASHCSGVWSSSSFGPGALQAVTTGSTNRLAGVWFGTSWSMNVSVNGTHQLALYLLDIDNHGYAETITITDASSHAVLDTETASNFSGGVYLTWNVSGNVTIRFTSTASHWAVLSGIFFGGAGSTAPTMPTGLTATAGSKQIALAWTASAGATSYNVYRGNTPGAESTVPVATGITGTNYTSTGLTNGTTYYYKVVGINAVGGSIPSPEASATPGMAVVAFVKQDLANHGDWKGRYGSDGWNVIGDTSGTNPSYPSYATVTPGPHYSGVWASSTSAPGALQSPSDVGSNRVAGVWYRQSWSMNVNIDGWHQLALYLYDYANSGYAETITISDAVTGTVLDTQSASSFGPGAYYMWDIDGNVTITFTSAPQHWAVLSGLFFGAAAETQVPDIPTHLIVTPSTGQVSLAWDAADRATTYNVYRGTAPGQEGARPIATGIGTAAYTDTRVSSGATYYYTLKAVNTTGTGDVSNEARATVPPAAPTNLNANGSDSQVVLTWTASSGATSFNIYRGTSPGGEGGTAIGTGVTTPYYTDMGLTNGTSYYYTVEAVNAGGTSPDSNEAGAIATAVPAPFRVACVGDSITNGVNLIGAGTATGQTYPAHLQSALGSGYNVQNFGVPGLSIMSVPPWNTTTTHQPYTSSSQYARSIAFNPNIVIIMLGAGDSWFPPSTGQTWSQSYMSLFTSQYASLIQAYKNCPAHPIVYVALCSRIVANSHGLDPTVLNTIIVPAVAGIAAASSCPTINEFAATSPYGRLYQDGVHPAAALTPYISAAVYKALTASVSLAPATPSVISATAGAGNVQVSWTAPAASVTTYNVYRSTNPGGEGTTPYMSNVPGYLTSFTDFGVSNGVTYYYTVNAVDSFGSSSQSTEVSATPGAGLYAGLPFTGSIPSIPGTVNFVNYDRGGQALAYNYASAWNYGGFYRFYDGVGIESNSDTIGVGYDVSWTAAGQWTNYTVNVSAAGIYQAAFRVASGGSGGTFHLADLSGTNLTGPVTVPATGGWGVWTTVNLNVNLPAGNQTLQLVQDSGGYSLNCVTFTSITQQSAK